MRIESMNDIGDAVVAGMEQDGLILGEADVAPEVFDLRTGIMGELLQKFANYRLRLAIVLPEPARHGERVVELVREHRSHATLRFFASDEEAREWLGGSLRDRA